MQIRIHPLDAKSLRDPAPLIANPGFGQLFTDRMLRATWTEGRGWHATEIAAYAPLVLDPAAVILHYGQEVFEGLKAYRWPDGRIALFRPEMNARRLNRSAVRLCMPEIPESDFVEGIRTLVDLERRWVPSGEGSSLYIRPTMIGTEVGLGVRPSNEYLYYVILSPAGPYFASGFAPVDVEVCEEFIRAAKGGTGEAKTSGNYAASLLAAKRAKSGGCSQVLWLDGAERRYIEEMGGMNVFFAFGDRLVTPPLTGSILPGVTRDSLLVLAPEMGYGVEERQIAIDEVLAGAESGRLTEAFACGTAAVLTPIGNLHHRGRVVPIGGGKTGPATARLFAALTDIQYGRAPDKHGWIKTL